MQTRRAKLNAHLSQRRMVWSLRSPILVSALYALATFAVAFRLPDAKIMPSGSAVNASYSVASFEPNLLHCNRTASCKGVLRARICQDMFPCMIIHRARVMGVKVTGNPTIEVFTLTVSSLFSSVYPLADFALAIVSTIVTPP
jgi:hypothetical protein